MCNAILNVLTIIDIHMDNATSGIEGAVSAAIIDIARDSGLDEAEAIAALNTHAVDMSTTERAQMLEALGGVHYGSIQELSDQIALINEGQKKEIEAKQRPTSE